ncbi:MAG: OmpA family protein [Pseudomonadota bacterium]
MNEIREKSAVYFRPSVALSVLFLLATLLSLNGCATAPSLAKQQTETLSKLGFEPFPDGWRLILPERISFESNKADLAPTVQSSIADTAHQLLAVNIRQLRVDGHSDNIGAREYNLYLSLRRANSVAEILIAEGFSKNNVESQGFGSNRPAADNETDEGRAQNRRVEIIVMSNAMAGP